MPRFTTVKLARPPAASKRASPLSISHGRVLPGAAGASVSSRRNAGDIAEGPEAARESAVCLDRIDAPVLSERLRIQRKVAVLPSDRLPLEQRLPRSARRRERRKR